LVATKTEAKRAYMASIITITEAKDSAKFLIKKNNFEPMASVLADPRQKTYSMALVHLESRLKSASIASGDNRGQKAPPFGLIPICLDSRPEAK